MGYSIEYSLEGSNITSSKKKKYRVFKIMSGGLLLAFILLLLFWPAARSVVREALIPGDSDVTIAAAECLIQELEQGNSISEALSAFCREVIADGAQP